MSSMLASKYQRYGFVYKEPFEPGDPDFVLFYEVKMIK